MISEKEQAFVVELRNSGDPIKIAGALIIEAGMTPFVFDIIKAAKEQGISPSDLSIALLTSAFSHIHGITRIVKDPEWTESLRDLLFLHCIAQTESLGK